MAIKTQQRAVCKKKKEKRISIDYEVLTVHTKVDWGHLKEHHLSYITAIPKRTRKKKSELKSRPEEWMIVPNDCAVESIAPLIITCKNGQHVKLSALHI